MRAFDHREILYLVLNEELCMRIQFISLDRFAGEQFWRFFSARAASFQRCEVNKWFAAFNFGILLARLLCGSKLTWSCGLGVLACRVWQLVAQVNFPIVAFSQHPVSKNGMTADSFDVLCRAAADEVLDDLCIRFLRALDSSFGGLKRSQEVSDGISRRLLANQLLIIAGRVVHGKCLMFNISLYNPGKLAIQQPCLYSRLFIKLHLPCLCNLLSAKIRELLQAFYQYHFILIISHRQLQRLRAQCPQSLLLIRIHSGRP
ncbi:hypothetical protein FGO68_gene14849 [Halteria grandinella]|uniref:Uncharacterized protein n=1 Tax=Halteria grandinella TaxID=5974 RepID=A0A8J8T6Y9_HALGN|nr:hypothetical protein FGO68_gene14849 [Halteria grandinella]